MTAKTAIAIYLIDMGYAGRYAAGSILKIASRKKLEEFRKSRKLHNPLTPEQLEFAGYIAKVENVGFYEVGDALYILQGIPGIWHEACLENPLERA